MEIKLKDMILGNGIEKTIGIALGDTLNDLVVGLDSETIHTATVDIQLSVNGQDIGLTEFFKNLTDNYFKYLGQTAKQLILGDITDKLSELVNVCQNAQNKIEGIESNIDWDIQCLKRSFENKNISNE